MFYKNKPDVLVRPVVSYSESPSYSLNKHIANILSTYIRDKNNNTKNSTNFSSALEVLTK